MASPVSERVPERSPSTAWQSIDGETVLLRMQARELLGLNAVGRRIWELADGTRSVDQIAGVLTEEFDVPAERARADTLGFVEELLALGALRLRERE